MTDLSGKTALVTGAARRLGRAIALRLAACGADVIVHYRSSHQEAEDTAQQIRSLGQRAGTISADLADPAQISQMFDTIAQQWKRVDILVNNASIYNRTPIETLTAQQWDSQMAVNARGPAMCIHHCLPLMPDGSAIVNVTDISAEKTWAGYPAYCASKAALLALTKSTAKALAVRQITVNAVAPGAILWEEGISTEQKQQVLAQIPMKRIGCPEDIANAVEFLASQNYITAQTLRVDGGWHMS